MRTIISIFAVSLLSAQAQTPALKTFDSPDAAAQAAISAAEKNDVAELTAIFGTKSKAVLSTGDPEQDKQERAEFARVARSKHRIEKDPMNLHRVILDVGPEDWPFPVPIVENNGKWSFDPVQGDLEVRARRIGANELDTMEELSALVAAQNQYAEADRDSDGILEFARLIMSSPGKTDGLYSEKMASPSLKVLADAEIRPGKPKGVPYHGYYYRVLESQGAHADGGAHAYVVDGKHMMGGFALVAWPAEYGVTGIHTFIVNRNGNVFEKDLGKPVSNLTAPVRIYDPDKSWQRVDDDQ
jgi:Protein of unknown function (DUF2950)